MSEEILYQMMDKLTSIETRIDGIDRRIDSIDSRLDSMDSRFDSMDSRFDSIESRMATKDDITELHSKFNVMSSDLQRMETKLDATFEQVAHLSEFEFTVNQLAISVEENTTDIKLLKKIVSNF